MADFSKDKAKMGQVCQRGRRERWMFPSTFWRAKERAVIKNIFGWEGDSFAYKGFCPHSKNKERSVFVLMPEVLVGWSEVSCPLSDTFMKALWWARAVVGRLPVAPGFESGLRVKAIPGHSMEAGCTHVHPRIYPHSHQSHWNLPCTARGSKVKRGLEPRSKAVLHLVYATAKPEVGASFRVGQYSKARRA